MLKIRIVSYIAAIAFAALANVGAGAQQWTTSLLSTTTTLVGLN